MKTSKNKFMCLVLTVAIILTSMFTAGVSVEASVPQTIPSGSYYIRSLTDRYSYFYTYFMEDYISGNGYSGNTKKSILEVRQYANSYTISKNGLYLKIQHCGWETYEIVLDEFDETQFELYLFDFIDTSMGYLITPNALPDHSWRGQYFMSGTTGAVYYEFVEAFQLEDGAEYCIKNKNMGKYITSGFTNDPAKLEELVDAEPEYLDYKTFTITKYGNSTNIFYIHNDDGYLSVRPADGKIISVSSPDDSCKFKIESMQNGSFTITSTSNYRLSPVLERREYYIAQENSLNYVWNFERVYSDPINLSSSLSIDASPQAGFIIKYNQSNVHYFELNAPYDSTIIYGSGYLDLDGIVATGEFAILITPEYVANVKFYNIYQW